MRGAEGVERRLATPGKTGDSVELTNTRHRVASAGEDFVGIGLVADIPHDSVVRRIEHVMQGDT